MVIGISSQEGRNATGLLLRILYFAVAGFSCIVASLKEFLNKSPLCQGRLSLSACMLPTLGYVFG